MLLFVLHVPIRPNSHDTCFLKALTAHRAYGNWCGTLPRDPRHLLLPHPYPSLKTSAFPVSHNNGRTTSWASCFSGWQGRNPPSGHTVLISSFISLSLGLAGHSPASAEKMLGRACCSASSHQGQDVLPEMPPLSVLLSDGSKTEILNLWAMFVSCAPWSDVVLRSSGTQVTCEVTFMCKHTVRVEIILSSKSWKIRLECWCV